MEGTVPWWRRALKFALSGIRSGFGLFTRNGKHEASPPPQQAKSGLAGGPSPEAGAESKLPMNEIENPEEDTALKHPSPNSEEVATEVETAEIATTSTGRSVEAELAEVPPCEEEQAADIVYAEKPVEPEVAAAAAEVPAEAEVQPAKIVAAKAVRAEASAEEQAVDVAAVQEITELVETEAAATAAEVPAEAEVQPAEIAAAKVVQVEADAEEQAVDVAAAQEMTELVETEAAATAAEVPAEAEVQPAEIAAAKVAQAESCAEEQEIDVVATEEMTELVETEADATAAAPAELVDGKAEAASGDDAVTEDIIAAEALAESNSAQAKPAPAETGSAAFAEADPATADPAPIEEIAAQQVAEREIPVVLPFAPETTADRKAARVAAALKARGEDAEQSPFSVIVSQVYDGPLDLLLDLIRKQDIDIYDIPIAKITAQFLAYVDQLKASDMDVAGEFIYTAALLIHIKSKMLLPRAPAGPEEAAEDPRRELVERLLEHERFKNAAQMLKEKQMLEAATWTNPGAREFREEEGAEAETAPEIAADTVDLVRVFRNILERARNRPIINVDEDAVTVSQMIQFLARRLTMEDKPVALRRLLSHTRSERALIAMFLALLELVRLQAILLRQDRQFSEIFIKKHTGFDAAMNQGLANARDDWR